MATATEKIAQHVAEAAATIETARTDSDDRTVKTLERLYQRTAAYLEAFADRQAAEAALRAADEVLRQEQVRHTSDVHEERELRIDMLPLATYDHIRDVDRLRAGAARFAELAAACR